MTGYSVKPIHISLIRPGDTILRNAKPSTVCPSNIKQGFMGTSLFGDSYKAGTVPVQLVVFNCPSTT